VTLVTTATVAAASAAATTATAVSVSSGLRFVDTQGATIKVRTVHSFDCRLSGSVVFHFHKAEPATGGRCHGPSRCVHH
jgi:hypothetical protein